MGAKLTNLDVDARLNGIKRLDDYLGNATHIRWQCVVCSYTWTNIPDRVIGKKNIGCPQCGNHMKATNETVDFRLPADVIRIGIVTGIHDKIEFQCKTCNNLWHSTPSNIINCKSGCPKCSDNKITNVSIDVKLVDRLITRQDPIINTHTRINWRCIKCTNTWLASPNSVINGKSGCPKCKKFISAGETDWLEYMQVPNDSAHRQVIIHINRRKFKVDGFNPLTNTVYEYWGDYWHGNPKFYNPHKVNHFTKKTFGELYDVTQTKRLLITSAGYKLEEIWEHEWNALSKVRNKHTIINCCIP